MSNTVMSNIAQHNASLRETSSRAIGLGNGHNSTFSVFRGLNALGGLPPLPPNTDNQGFVFFTKPCMNLSYNNVINIRKMAYLADSNPQSMGCAIRCMLNPIEQLVPAKVPRQTRSAIVDDKCAFLPISNLLLTLSPPPDTVADVYTSPEGYNKEQVSWIDSLPYNYGAYDLTATFANMEGDPITTLFSSWIEYGQRVLNGSMLPFPINIIRNRVDYQTRIYRLVMDRSKTFVQKIYACGAAFPTSDPEGAAFGYNNGQHITQENDQISITFRCLGAMYNDPILIEEFNYTVARFNPDMKVSRDGKIKNMVKVDGITQAGIPRKALLNYRMYPRISPTMELEWYCTKEDYAALLLLDETFKPITKEELKQQPTGSPTLTPITDKLIKEPK